MGWIGVIAATGQHPDEPALDPLVILVAGVVLLLVLWGAAFVLLARRR